MNGIMKTKETRKDKERRRNRERAKAKSVRELQVIVSSTGTLKPL